MRALTVTSSAKRLARPNFLILIENPQKFYAFHPKINKFLSETEIAESWFLRFCEEKKSEVELRFCGKLEEWWRRRA